MNELFPIVGGLVAGMITTATRRDAQPMTCLVLGFLVGAVSTMVTGEYRVGWYYVVLDTALAVGAALSVLAIATVFRLRADR